MKLRIIVLSKRIIILAVIFMLLAGLLQASDSYAKFQWKKEIFLPGLQGKTVIIDPGHGGADPGAVSGRYRESDLNMETALALKSQLEDNGIKVKLTRNGSEGIVPKENMTYAEQWANLRKRKEFAAEQRGHLLLSIHTNSHQDSRVSGAIVFYTDEVSADLAAEIQARLNTLGTKKRSAEQKNFAVIKGNPMPAVLIETGFITNEHDREMLVSSKGTVAKLIYEALDRYYQEPALPQTETAAKGG
ncbi:N-acetylmuramoyl-L-alanine amidase family protein [Phosphitispora fastidiosa]|uniref:N-acetylmuramoyl-L-alanine amidase family protein n=1 Tax=Phosphitispora fastidiosa TaxID=2837202 RepID=UPI001E426117|nr:N-acetylmuramoyl-L-alanine amidase [Phosphitispora fastidiosa]MBU7007038.1 N-acetylmuramoyl-L-alanine amidase [Phosphitispora fastidiosa]